MTDYTESAVFNFKKETWNKLARKIIIANERYKNFF